MDRHRYFPDFLPRDGKRLRNECALRENEDLWRDGRGFIVRDLPRSEAELRKIPPFEFENWAVIALGGIPNKAQVGDKGIDGRIYPVSATNIERCARQREREAGAHELGFMDQWYPIQVKQKDKTGRPDIDSFPAVMAREERTKGIFVSFDSSSDAMTEMESYFRQTGKVIVPLTVNEILDGQSPRIGLAKPMPWQFFQYLRALMKHAWAILAAIGGSALLALPSLVRPALSPTWQRQLDSLLTSSPTEIRHAYLVLLPVGFFWATYRAWKEENDARIKAEKESPADLRAELASVRTELEGLRRHQQRSITRQQWDAINGLSIVSAATAQARN